MSSKIVIHEQFLVCQDFTFDTFWREIIYSCACNRFPMGVKYDQLKNTMHVRYEHAGRAKNESHLVPKDPYETYTLLRYIFKELLGLRSDHDINLSIQELEEIRLKSDIDLDCDWKKLKPRSMRNQLLMNFAVTEANKHDFNAKGAKYLYNVIQLGFQFKQLTSDDVQYGKGVVTAISGFEYDEISQDFIITNQQKSLIRTDKLLSRSNRLNQTIDQWIRDYKTYYILNLHD